MILDGLGKSLGSTEFLAPFMANLIQLSELRLGDAVLLTVCAIFKLDSYDFIVLLLRLFLAAAQVTKARANSTLIGSSNLTR